MSITGPPNGSPYRLGVAIADIVSGMFAAYGVAMALLVQARTGRGQFVDVAMLDSVAAILTYQAGICFATGQAPPRLGNQHPTIVPYETFSAADGDVVVAAGNDTLFRKFCDVLEMPALAEDPRFATNQGRVEHHRHDAGGGPGTRRGRWSGLLRDRVHRRRDALPRGGTGPTRDARRSPTHAPSHRLLCPRLGNAAALRRRQRRCVPVVERRRTRARAVAAG